MSEQSEYQFCRVWEFRRWVPIVASDRKLVYSRDGVHVGVSEVSCVVGVPIEP